MPLETETSASLAAQGREPFFGRFGESLDASSSTDLAAKLSIVGDHVPGRIEGRRQRHRERYCAVALLRALNTLGRLRFPLRVEKRERPDLMLWDGAGYAVGVEISTVSTQTHEEAATVLEKRGTGWALEGERRLVLPGGELRESPWHANDPQRAFAKLFWDAVRPKVDDLNEPDYNRADAYSLLLYDNSHLLMLFELDTLGQYLVAEDGPAAGRLFDRVDVLRDDTLLLDALGERRLVRRADARHLKSTRARLPRRR